MFEQILRNITEFMFADTTSLDDRRHARKIYEHMIHKFSLLPLDRQWLEAHGIKV